MSPFDISTLAMRNLRRRGGRSLLAGLAVALGSALLVALVAIAATADSRVVSQLSKGGPLAAIHVDDSRPSADALQSDYLHTSGHHDIDLGTVQAIRSSPYVSGVATVLAIPTLAVPCPVEHAAGPGCQNDPQPYNSALVGADLTQGSGLPVTVLFGRLPGAHSMNEVAVTQSYLDRILVGPERGVSVLGTFVDFGTPRVTGAADHLQGRWIGAMVVGVVSQSIQDGDFLVPMDQAQAARAFALTGDPDPRVLPGITSGFSALVVVADGLDHVHAVREEIFSLGYASSAPEHLVASVLRYLHVVDIVLFGIGLVAVSIAVLGIANSLLAAVRERWREIGVLKAIGADDSDILAWFLFEAAVLGVAGGVVGTLAGLAVAWTIGLQVNSYLAAQGLQGVDLTQVPVSLAVIAPVGTAMLAMLAGAVPALQAARLPAREAIGAL